MIFNAKAQDDLYRLIRHIENQMQRGASFEEAVANLKSVEEIDEQKVSFLEGLLKGKPTESAHLSSYRMASEATIAKLLTFISQSGSGPGQSMAALKTSLRMSHNSANQVLKGVKGLSIYLVAIFSLVTVCTSIYMVKVLPQFRELFDGMGAGLPVFTEYTLRVGDFLGGWWILLLLILVFMVYQMLQTGNRIAALRPLGTSAKWLPGMAKIGKLHLRYLVVSYSHILIKGGVPGAKALDDAAMLAENGDREANIKKIDKDEWFKDLLIARKLKTLEPEMEQAFQDIEYEYLSELGRLREKIMLSLQIIMALIVGAIVIAMYLPIFQLGQIV